MVSISGYTIYIQDVKYYIRVNMVCIRGNTIYTQNVNYDMYNWSWVPNKTKYIT